jgi:hypothetical protein
MIHWAPSPALARIKIGLLLPDAPWAASLILSEEKAKLLFHISQPSKSTGLGCILRRQAYRWRSIALLNLMSLISLTREFSVKIVRESPKIKDPQDDSLRLPL